MPHRRSRQLGKSRGSLVKSLFEAEIQGRGIKRISELPHTLFTKSLDGFFPAIAPVLCVLEDGVNYRLQSTDQLLVACKTLLSLLKYSRLQGDFAIIDSVAETAIVSKAVKKAATFREHGGLDLLILILLSFKLPDEGEELALQSEPEKLKKFESTVIVLKKVLEALTRLCVVDAECGTYLAESSRVLDYCFELVTQKQLYAPACDLVEHMFLARKDLLSLESIPNIRAQLARIDEDKLASLCRVLAVSVSDVEDTETRTTLVAQHRQKKQGGEKEENPTQVKNRDVLLTTPNVLEKVLHAACKLPLQPRYGGAGTETDNWIHFIDAVVMEGLNNMPHVGTLNLDTPESMDVDSQVSAECVSGPLTKRVDAIYMLSLLIAGSHRTVAQDKLAELNLAPKLNALFDQLIWREQDHGQAAGHVSRCNCSPEVILKIQFLRLVHNYCYHSSHKLTLLSYDEWKEICQLSEEVVDPEDLFDGVSKPDFNSLSKENLCGNGPGLLTKIVMILKNEPVESVFRFWLCRAVESWLRGSCTPADQLFVIRRGLLQHIAKVVVEGVGYGRTAYGQDAPEFGGLPREVAQSSFDLLGEIVRFSAVALKELDAYLSSDRKVRRFFSAINANMVDSNMFLRSVFLSLDHFMSPGKSDEKQREILKSSRFFGPLLHIRRRVAYLACLISTVSVETLTQENISCLNTVLILLMLAQQREELPKTLEALADPTYPTFRRSTRDTCSEPDPALVPPPPLVLSCLLQLLRFWKVHYKSGDQNCISLEKSSRISFNDWQIMVTQLTLPDRTSRNSLFFYLPESHCRDQPVFEMEVEA